jgi:ATP-dependent RNA helicase DeaD
VQVAALDAIDGSRDLRISSQTGSGKTVALGLAIAPDIIARATAGGRSGPDALVVVPTRELAAQVHKELAWLYAGVHGVGIDSVTGGTHVGQERRRLKRGPRILVGTHGRLVDHIGSGALDCSAVQQLVLDEADQMLDMGFREDLESIVAAMPAAPPSSTSSRATLVITACSRPWVATASATRRGSSGSSGSGLRVSTWQNPQARVQRSPRIMKVAVRSAQHS